MPASFDGENLRKDISFKNYA